jgi:hypothetical protein
VEAVAAMVKLTDGLGVRVAFTLAEALLLPVGVREEVELTFVALEPVGLGLAATEAVIVPLVDTLVALGVRDAVIDGVTVMVAVELTVVFTCSDRGAGAPGAKLAAGALTWKYEVRKHVSASAASPAGQIEMARAVSEEGVTLQENCRPAKPAHQHQSNGHWVNKTILAAALADAVRALSYAEDCTACVLRQNSPACNNTGTRLCVIWGTR